MTLGRAAGVVILCFIVSSSIAQKKSGPVGRAESFAPKNPIVCYSAAGDANTVVPPPVQYLRWKKNPAGRSKTANFIVTYDGFSDEAKQSFQAAVDIWETLIVSTVPIRISAFWRSLDTNVLGSASPGTYYRNFDGAQKHGVWYPISMAEKMAGKELNDTTDPDIVASFNSANTNWNFTTTGAPVAGKHDMLSVVLHEIGHGLGITHSYEVSGNIGQISDFFSDTPVVFESLIENQTPTSLVTGFLSPSADLGTQLTSEALALNSPLVLAKNNGTKAVIYAPSPYSSGSSIAHLNEDTYPRGTENSLMTPSLNSAEVIHNPGPIIMGALKDMGWNNVFIQHTPLPSTEDISSDFPIKCLIKSDTAYDAASVKLFYTSNGTTFTSVTMTSTGNANEFQSLIPKTGTTVTYGYYISLVDKAGRTFVKPGKRYTQGSPTVVQELINFTAGPDTQPPTITHSPKGFIQNTQTQLKLSAIVKDNISLKDVRVEYLIKDVAQPVLFMTNTKDSTYEATISVTGLVNGDQLKYRIKATDNAASPNLNSAPSTGFFVVNVVSLAPVQNTYANNFNTATSDMFGDPQFSIATPTGFSNGAIHSVHPYPNGTGANFESHFVYQLRVPIKLKAADATLKFDEIVLAEPSDVGEPFGGKNFFDYVVVEGSKDGGVTWKPFADGYDSRLQSKWLDKWNSSFDTGAQPNSTAVGDPSLFISHTIDMLASSDFKSGDEVVIRFRLFADQLVHGWGWAIDNLKIQVDDIAPTILHHHSDFLVSTANSFKVTTNVKDAGGLKDLIIEYNVNGGVITSTPLTISAGIDQYELNLSLAGSGLVAGDEIQYRIKSTDLSDNSAALPATGFFHVPLLSFANTLTTYVSDFNTTHTDFVGNFFSITKPTGFSDGAIHSSHPYLNGFGLDNTSSYQYMLKKPILVDATNPIMSFNEIVLTEFSGTNVKDYVILEGSKDNGVTWQSLLDPYSANANQSWATAFGSTGTPALYKNRTVDMTKTGKFKAGDAVLIRFRLMADAVINGWGWAIDNVSIQGPVTGLENVTHGWFEMYPNPVSSDQFTIKLSQAYEGASIEIFNLQGQSVLNAIFQHRDGEQKIQLGNLADGMYLVRINSKAGVLTEKIVVKR